MKAWQIATKQKPTHRQAWTNMILLFDNLGKHDKALEMANEALSYIPKESSIHFNVGNILGKKQKYEEAELHFKLAITEDPKNPTCYTNLGNI